MIAPLRRRVLRASLALTALATFLAASGADARGLDPCPHHDALALARHGAAAGADGGHDPDHAVRAGHEHHPRATEPAEDHGPCTCVGSCDTGGSAHVLAPAPGVSILRVAAAPLPLPAHPHELVRSRGERWTPYLPNAPPASA